VNNGSLKISNAHNSCVKCINRKNCINSILSEDEVSELTNVYAQRIHLKKGENLYRNGGKLTSIYNIRVGVIKTEYTLPDGRQQVVKFNMPGDLIGIDGIQDGKYHSDTYALVDTEICSINFTELQKMASKIPSLQRKLDGHMSGILNEIQDHIFLLGSLSSNEKLAHFLLHYSYKLDQLNYKSDDFSLPMNREELSSYLGVTVETLSRTFTNFVDEGFIAARNKHIKIISSERLNQI